MFSFSLDAAKKAPRDITAAKEKAEEEDGLEE